MTCIHSLYNKFNIIYIYIIMDNEMNVNLIKEELNPIEIDNAEINAEINREINAEINREINAEINGEMNEEGENIVIPRCYSGSVGEYYKSYFNKPSTTNCTSSSSCSSSNISTCNCTNISNVSNSTISIIQNDSICNQHLKASCVDECKIKNYSITSCKLANSCINSNHILNGCITLEKLACGVICPNSITASGSSTLTNKIIDDVSNTVTADFLHYNNKCNKISVYTSSTPQPNQVLMAVDSSQAIWKYIDHNVLLNNGTHTHAEIDEFMNNHAHDHVNDHLYLLNIGTNTHAQIDAHIAGSTNVHGIGSGSSVVGTATTQTLTNKTLDSSTNTISADFLHCNNKANKVNIYSGVCPTANQALIATDSSHAIWKTIDHNTLSNNGTHTHAEIDDFIDNHSHHNLTYYNVHLQTNFSLSSTLYTEINGMTLSPAAGTYLCLFECDYYRDCGVLEHTSHTDTACPDDGTPSSLLFGICNTTPPNVISSSVNHNNVLCYEQNEHFNMFNIISADGTNPIKILTKLKYGSDTIIFINRTLSLIKLSS